MLEDMSEFVDSVRLLIEAGDLESALDKILKCLGRKNAQLHNEATMHKASLVQNNRSLRQGIIAADDATRARARITLAVLSLLIDIEREELKCSLRSSGPDLNMALGNTNDRLRILFLCANPTNTMRIRGDTELREIEIALRLSSERERIVLSQRWAVTPAALQQAMLDENPDIVHFSGHGSHEGIILEAADGDSNVVTEQALENLFSLFSQTVRCIVLNSCYSEPQARAIARQIPFIVGMTSAVADKTAISFATGFYRALGAGTDVEFAYRLGINSVQLEGLNGSEIPKLYRRA